MHSQPTIEFTAILAAIVGTLWVSLPVKPSTNTRTPAGVHGIAGELRTGGRNLLDETRAGLPFRAAGIERTENVRQDSSSRTEHQRPHFEHPAWAIELGRRESNNMDAAIGDRGAAHGRYQFTKAAWADTSAWRAKRGLDVKPFTMAHNDEAATGYLISWFQLNRERWVRLHRREPTMEQLFEIHRRGFEGMRRK